MLFGGVFLHHFLLFSIAVDISFIYFLIKRKDKKFLFDKTFLVLFLLIVGTFLISFTFSIYFFNSIISFLYFLTFTLLFFLSGYLLDGGEEKLHHWVFFIDFLMLLGFFEVISGFLFYFTGVKSFLGYHFVNISPGLHGTFVNKNHYSAFLEILLPFSLWGVFYKRDKISKYIYGILSIMFLFSIILSLSRGGVFSALISITVFILFYGFISKSKIYRYLALLPVILVILFTATFNKISGRIATTIFQFKNFEGTIKRLLIWKGSLNALFSNVFFGVGPGNFPVIFTHYRPVGLNGAPKFAHNELLHFGVELGIFFTIFFLLFIFYIFYILYRGSKSSLRPEKKGLYAATFSSFLAIFIHSQVDFPLHIPVISIVLITLFIFAHYNFNWNYFKGVRKRVEIRIRPIFTIFISLVVILSLFLLVSQIFLNRGKDSFKNGEYEKAQNEYKLSMNIFPLNSEVPFNISNIYESQLKFGVNRVEKYDKCISFLFKAIKLNPEKGFYWLKLVEVSDSFFFLSEHYWKYLYQKDFSKLFLEKFEKFLNRKFKNSSDLVDYLFFLANKKDKNNFVLLDLWAIHFMRMGKKEKASSLVYKSFLNEPQLSNHTLFTKKVLLDNFREEVKRALLVNVKKKRYFKDSSIFLVDIYNREGNIKKAFDIINSYLSIYKNDTDFLFLKGKYSLKIGYINLAFESFKRYMELFNYGNGEVIRVLSEMLKYKGIDFLMNYLKNNNYLFNEDPEIYFWLSKIYYKNGNYDKAILYLKKYIRNNGEDSDAFYFLGEIYFSKKDYLKGTKYFFKAFEKGYTSERLYLKLAEGFVKMGNPQLAKKYLEIGLEKYKNSIAIKNSLKNLNGEK